MGYINRPNNFTTFLVNPGGGMLGILWCLLPSSREVRTANSAASLPLKVFILNTYLLILNTYLLVSTFHCMVYET